MSTIPASFIVQVLPGVIAAGGTSLVLNGVMITDSARMQGGVVLSFPSADSVGSYFGPTSLEYALAQNYFNGYVNATKRPGALLMARYPQNSVAAWVRGGKISTLTIAQLQAVSGDLTVTVDGYPRTGAVSLSGATSYSAAAALIQSALNANEPTEATVTGAIAAKSVTITGSIAGDLLTVTAAGANPIAVGARLTGSAVASGTQIVAQVSGATGGVGVYAVNISQSVASRSMTATYGVMTVTSVSTGTVSIGQTVTGAGVTAGTVVTDETTGSGLAGDYIVNLSQTVASEALTLKATDITVSFDSISGGLLITSGVTGTASSVAYATGAVAAPLMLTAGAGAVLSQGMAAKTPGAFMDWLKGVTQNWASFFTTFDPDGGSGNTQKLAFATWNSAQNNRYTYLASDGDIAPTLANTAPTSLGYLIGPNGSNLSGTAVIYDPQDPNIAAFLSGAIASLDFDRREGRTTLAFRSQSGIAAEVTDETTAANLQANGYNFYGAFATANDDFIWVYDGRVCGPFKWLDTYVNQIWMNNQFQLDLMVLLQQANSIPYNDAGYARIEASLMTTIGQAKTFGAIREGIDLSSGQKMVVNTAAGFKIDDVLTNRGWYLLIQKTPPQTRQARGTPPITFFYCDGESIQKITLASQVLL